MKPGELKKTKNSRKVNLLHNSKYKQIKRWIGMWNAQFKITHKHAHIHACKHTYNAHNFEHAHPEEG